MKSRYIANTGDANAVARKVAREEIEKHTKEICPSCQQNIANQVAAVMCRALALNHGFGKKRLKALISETEWLFELCDLDGKRWKATDCIKWLRDEMGIDLERSEQSDTG